MGPDEWHEHHNAPVFVVTLIGSAFNVTNMGSALNVHVAGRTVLDLTNAADIRFFCHVNIAGSTEAIIRVQYSTDATAALNGTWQEFGTLADVSMSLAAVGYKRTAWLPIPSVTDPSSMMVRSVLEGGDGAADPQFTNLAVQYR